MLTRIISESKYYSFYEELINSLKIQPDIIDIDGDQITIYFFDKMSDYFIGEKKEHNYKNIENIENYLNLISEIYVNDLLVNKHNETWLNDLYSYTYKINLQKFRDYKINKVIIS